MMGSDAYSATGFRRFFDRLMRNGLEAFGLYYGQYQAFVVENEDADNQGKLIIRVPGLGDTPNTRRLAYPKVPAGGAKGAKFGFHYLPPVGSVVWVTFEAGRLDMPIWEGSWHLKDGLPDVWRDNVQAGGLVSPGGHEVFFFDDKDDQKTLRVKHSNGALIEIDNDGNIRISNKDGQTVFVGLNAEEAAVLGDTLKGLLDELVEAILKLTVPTGVGPSGTPINSAEFNAVKAKFEQFLSQTVKVK